MLTQIHFNDKYILTKEVKSYIFNVITNLLFSFSDTSF
jgi:hypothetical protein